jgi:hypothetical protein
MSVFLSSIFLLNPPLGLPVFSELAAVSSVVPTILRGFATLLDESRRFTDLLCGSFGF